MIFIYQDPPKSVWGGSGKKNINFPPQNFCAQRDPEEDFLSVGGLFYCLVLTAPPGSRSIRRRTKEEGRNGPLDEQRATDGKSQIGQGKYDISRTDRRGCCWRKPLFCRSREGRKGGFITAAQLLLARNWSFHSAVEKKFLT